MHIVHKIGQEIGKIGRELSHEDLEFDVSVSSNLAQGDVSTNFALIHFKKIGCNSPREAAIKIAAEFEAMAMDEIDKIEVAGPGFINFFLSQNYLYNSLTKVIQNCQEYVKMDNNLDQKFLVEYSSPNIAKPFTIGHLRSTIIGDAIANLLEATGYSVKRDNHLGDWGTQFGKQIYAIKAWGNEDEIENSENPVKELVALYVKFHDEAERRPEIEGEAREWFRKLENGDSEARRLWQKCVDWSMKEFKRLYGKLGVSFTENNRLGYGESFFEDKMLNIVSELRKKNLLIKDEGADLVYFKNDYLPPLMILKKDGTTLYATRDLATDKFRLDTLGAGVTIINEVGGEQELYFRQLFELEKMLGWITDGQRVHVRHGHYRFADGKMSTRKGNVIWLDDVLKEAENRAGNETIAIGAIKWNDLKRDSKQDVTFDWDDVLNMQGNSGPYMQYAYVRTVSVLQKSGSSTRELVNYPKRLDAEEADLLRLLSQYPYHVEVAAGEYAPHIFCTYLFELAQKYNHFYEKCKIIGSENESFRLRLTDGVGQGIQFGLKILGIGTVEKM